MVAEALPVSDRRLGIVAGAIEDIDAEPVRLRFGLADQPGIAPEIAEDTTGHPGRIQSCAVPKHIVCEFVGEQCGQLLIVGKVVSEIPRHLDVATVGIRIHVAGGIDHEVGRAALFRLNPDTGGRRFSPQVDIRRAIGEGAIDRSQQALRLRGLSAGNRSDRQRFPVQSQHHIVPPQARSFRRTACGDRQHLRFRAETEGANRQVPEIGAILRELMNGEARQPRAVRAEVEIVDGQPMPDGCDAFVLNPQAQERFHLLVLPGRSRREERKEQRSCCRKTRKGKSNQELLLQESRHPERAMSYDLSR